MGRCVDSDLANFDAKYGFIYGLTMQVKPSSMDDCEETMPRKSTGPDDKASYSNKIHVTTVRLPETLYVQAIELVKRGVAGSLNEVIMHSIDSLVKQNARIEVDKRLARMAEDQRYLEVSMGLYKLFEKDAVASQAKIASTSGAAKSA
jgi:hypothetical protein